MEEQQKSEDDKADQATVESASHVTDTPSTGQTEQTVETENQSEQEKSNKVEDTDKQAPQEVMEVEENVEVDMAAIEKLTQGVLDMFLPNLQQAKASLNELLHNQEVLIETVQQENSKFSDSVAMKQLVDMMLEAKRYHTKLVNLKREMNALTDKSTKLKRRAVKIQQQKQKEELTRADQLERDRERERMLTAKVAKPSSKNTNP